MENKGNSSLPRVPPPHGDAPPFPVIPEDDPQSGPSGTSCPPAVSGSSSGSISSSSAESVLPQDKSTLQSADSLTADLTSQQQIYLYQQMQIKEQLVYPPPRSAKPPTTEKVSSTVKTTSLPKTPLANSSNLNNPPEAGSRGDKISPEELMRRRKILQEQMGLKPTSQEDEPARKTMREEGYGQSTSGRAAPGPSNSQRLENKQPLQQQTTPQESESLVVATSRAATPRQCPAGTARALQLKQPHNYEELEVIGNGAYGTVYRGRDLTDKGRVVALKKIRISLTEDGVPVCAVREISLLKNLDNFRHPNVVRLLDICHGPLEHERRLNLVLVFEYVEMDLDTYMKRVPAPGLEPARIKTIMHQILSGVDFLHQNRIIHRDLKPQNILVDRYDRLKIADFGLARIYDYNMRLTTMVVTLWYRAPEVLLSDSYATPVDIWSCACIFAELFRKRPLFEGQNDKEQLQRIFEVIGTPSEREWPNNVSVCVSQFQGNYPRPIPDVVPEITDDAADLLQRMLKFVPDIRASAAQSLQHRYFQGLKAIEALPAEEEEAMDTSSPLARPGPSHEEESTSAAGGASSHSLFCDETIVSGGQTPSLGVTSGSAMVAAAVAAAAAARGSPDPPTSLSSTNDENNPNSTNINAQKCSAVSGTTANTPAPPSTMAVKHNNRPLSSSNQPTPTTTPSTTTTNSNPASDVSSQTRNN